MLTRIVPVGWMATGKLLVASRFFSLQPIQVVSDQTLVFSNIFWHMWQALNIESLLFTVSRVAVMQ